MKIFSKMLSKKTEPEAPVDKIDFDMDAAPLRRRTEAVADDSGEINATRRGGTDRLTEAPDPAPDPAPLSAADDWDDDDWDDDEDWGDEEADDLSEAAEARRESRQRSDLVSEIRDAVVSVSHVQPEERAAGGRAVSEDRPFRDWSEDEDFGRKAKARSQLTGVADAAEDRILEKTNTQMTDRETSRRRSAMAHLKAAAAATKADRVLKHAASNDAAADLEEQSPYRDDLAKVVRPHNPSRPISRPVSRRPSRAPDWDSGTGDDDAALFAAASEDSPSGRPVEDDLAAAEAERLARAPADLSEDEFAAEDDIPFRRGFGSEAPAGSAPGDEDRIASRTENAFSDAFDPDGKEEDDDDDGPTPSSAVAEAVAMANAPDEPEEVETESDVRRKIWEVADEVASEIEEVRKMGPENVVDVAGAVAGRSSGRGAGRVKTRLLGFQAGDLGQKDVFAAEKAPKPATEGNHTMYPVGWIIVIDGPGLGACFTLYSGASQIGRGEDQGVRLDFGDTSISRNNHAAVAFDDEQSAFYLGHGGKSNLVRLNGKPVLSTEELASGDEIRIGETTLKFLALCGSDFTWDKADGQK